MSRYAPGTTGTTTTAGRRPKPIISDPKPDRSSLEAKRAAVANATTKQAQQATLQQKAATPGKPATAQPKPAATGFAAADQNNHLATINNDAPKYGFGAAVGSDNVGAIANELMRHDSPLMERSRTMGAQFGNARGMLNSSLSAGAAQTAALDHVVPMSQTQAQINAERGEQAYNRTHTTGENKLDREHTSSENQLDRSHTSSENQLTRSHETNLQDLRQEHERLENALTRTHEGDMQNERIKAEIAENTRKMEHERSQAAKDRATEREQNAKDRQLEREKAAKEMELARLNVKDSDRKAASTMATSAHGHFQNTVVNTNNNTELGPEERASIISAAKANLDATYKSINSLFNLNVQWPTTVGGNRAAGNVQPAAKNTNASQTAAKPQSQFDKDMASLGRDTGRLR